MIYFIQVGDKGPIKIGTAVSPEERLKQLQIGNHEKLNLIAIIPGDSSLENKIHRDLRKFRRDGEWFDATTEVFAYIRDIQFSEYEPDGARAYAVLWRDTQKSKTDPCPFCGKRHTHGLGDGHRVAHCVDGNNQAKAKDGTILEKEHGYIIRTRNKARSV